MVIRIAMWRMPEMGCISMRYLDSKSETVVWALLSKMVLSNHEDPSTNKDDRGLYD